MRIPDLPVFRVPFWNHHEHLVHGCSTRSLGNLSYRSGIETEVRDRRAEFAGHLQIPPERLFAPKLTHSSNVAMLRDDKSMSRLNGLSTLPRERTVVREGHPAIQPIVSNDEIVAGIDGLIWDVPDIYGLIITADCAPVSFFDPATGACGAAHIGLVGAINGLARVMVYLMRDDLGVDPSDLEIVIYPSVRDCHYDLTRSGLWREIGTGVLSRTSELQHFTDLTHFDLPGMIAGQVIDCGVREEHIFDTGVCTACRHNLFYSNVAAITPEAKRTEGRFGAVLGRRG